MRSLVRFFKAHPASLNQSYLEHLRTAIGYSARLVRASAACAVHAVLPFMFQRTASGVVNELHDRMTRPDAPGEGER